MLEFPALGHVRKVRLFPDAEPGSDAHDVHIGVNFVGAGKAREWSLKVNGLRQRDQKKLAALRDGTTSKTAPMLWDETATTEEGALESFKLYKTVVVEGASSITGIRFGEQDSKLVTEPQEIAHKLEQYGLIEQAVARIIAAQSPSEEQELFLESQPS